MKYLQLPESAWPALARLSGLQVGIWADAWTWQQQGQRAFRTNDQLAEMFGCNERSIRRALNQLMEMGLVEVKRAGQMRFIVAKADQSVHGPTCPGREDQSVRKGGPIGPAREDQSVHQVYQSKSISKSPNKSLRVRAELEGVNEGLHFPWTSDAFMVAWQDFKEYMRVEHRYGFKSEHAEQLALVNLKNNFNDEHSAISAIGKTMASGWKSIPASQTRTRRTRVDRARGDDGNQERTSGRNF